jgi:hypothetical protein
LPDFRRRSVYRSQLAAIGGRARRIGEFAFKHACAWLVMVINSEHDN